MALLTIAVNGSADVGPRVPCSACHAVAAVPDGSGTGIVWREPKAGPSRPGGGGSAARFRELCLDCHKAGGGAPAVLGMHGTLDTTGRRHHLDSPSFLPTFSRDLRATDATADTSNQVSPGGDYPSADLTCTSCHDSHGHIISGPGTGAFEFRMLRKVVAGRDVSRTIGSDRQDGADLSLPISAQNKDIYRDGPGAREGVGGWEAWCGACHARLVGMRTGAGWSRHPSGTPLGRDAARNYGPTYDPEHPLAVGEGDDWAANRVAVVSPNSRVTCLTCHVAHASPYPYGLRWPYGGPMPADRQCRKCHRRGSQRSSQGRGGRSH